jgi:hypothetical protein
MKGASAVKEIKKEVVSKVVIAIRLKRRSNLKNAPIHYQPDCFGRPSLAMMRNDF